MDSQPDLHDEPEHYRKRFGWLEGSLALSIALLLGQLFGPQMMRSWQQRTLPGRQTPSSAQVAMHHDGPVLIHYWVFLPEDYSLRKKCPLLLYLHGSGERGTDLEIVKRHGPPALIATGKLPRMIVISPQCPPGSRWDAGELLALLDHVEKQLAVDPDRIYVAGNSMGGIGTWELIAAMPERFAAAAPVAGGGKIPDLLRLANLPIWAFHGALDKTIPIDSTQQIVDALRAIGSKAKLTVYENRGHDICDLTFQREDLLEWLLQQQRVRP